MFFKISQISKEKTSVGVSFLIKFADFMPATLLKKRLNTGVFCEICEILKTTFFSQTPPMDAFGSSCLR